MKRREKKSESLDIRLPYQQKQDFMAATRQRGETASQALRRYITTYIEEARLAEEPSKAQEITMTLARHRFKTLATAAGAALGVFSVSALPSAADSTAFDRLDKNKDGLITEGEILEGHDADIIAKLDTDGSGGVSRAELEAAGNHFVIESDISETGEDGETITRKAIKVLEFSDDKDGDVHTEVITKSSRNVVVKRLESGEELSKEELQAIIASALEEIEHEDGIEADVDVIIHKSDAHEADE